MTTTIEYIAKRASYYGVESKIDETGEMVSIFDALDFKSGFRIHADDEKGKFPIEAFTVDEDGETMYAQLPSKGAIISTLEEMMILMMPIISAETFCKTEGIGVDAIWIGEWFLIDSMHMDGSTMHVVSRFGNHLIVSNDPRISIGVRWKEKEIFDSE